MRTGWARLVDSCRGSRICVVNPDHVSGPTETAVYCNIHVAGLPDSCAAPRWIASMSGGSLEPCAGPAERADLARDLLNLFNPYTSDPFSKRVLIPIRAVKVQLQGDN